MQGIRGNECKLLTTNSIRMSIKRCNYTYNPGYNPRYNPDGRSEPEKDIISNVTPNDVTRTRCIFDFVLMGKCEPRIGFIVRVNSQSARCHSLIEIQYHVTNI